MTVLNFRDYNSLLADLSLQPLPAYSREVLQLLLDSGELYPFESNGMDWMLPTLARCEQLGLVEWGWPENFWEWAPDELEEDEIRNPRNEHRCVRPGWLLEELYDAGRLNVLLEAH